MTSSRSAAKILCLRPGRVQGNARQGFSRVRAGRAHSAAGGSRAVPAGATFAEEDALLAEHTELKSLLDVVIQEEYAEETFASIRAHVFASVAGMDELRQVLRTWEEAKAADRFRRKTDAQVVLGYLYYLNGELERAEEVLRHVKSQPWGGYWLARVLFDMTRRRDACTVARDLHEHHPDSQAIAWLLVDMQLHAGAEDKAATLMTTLQSKAGESSRGWFFTGLLAEKRGDYDAAFEAYEKAVALDGSNVRALFQLGYLGSRYSEDAEEAIAYYEACVAQMPCHVNALINLGLAFEDTGKYDEAIQCFNAVLRFYPTHPRAKLYLGDAKASTTMCYDREREKELSQQNQVLRMPISEFELSVRSRNCLAKMNIETLGDLIMKTRSELLSYKNFGETSLSEIEEILHQKGLTLGQGAAEEGEGAPPPPFAEEQPPAELEPGVDPEVLNRPVESLNLSIRSRRCMERLKLKTLRELVSKSEVELMSAKNFGVTSLNEVKAKLTEIGLALRV